MPSTFSKPHILVVSQYYTPDITAAAFRIEEMAKLLVQKGYEITIITAKPHRGKADEQKYTDTEGINVIRVPITKQAGRGFWDFIRHYTSFQVNSVLASMALKKKPSLVLATSPPLFAAAAGWCISFLRRVPLVLDIRDIWPDTAVTFGQLKENSKAYQLARKVEKFLYWQASLISCVARPMAEYLKKETKPEKCFVIYNGIPSHLIETFGSDVTETPTGETAAACQQDSRENGALTVMYVGNFGIGQNLQILIDAAEVLKKNNDMGIAFRLIGDGVLRSSLEEQVHSKKLGNVSIEGPFGKSIALEKMIECQTLVIPLKFDKTMERTIPSKVFDYMATGKPILYGIKGEGGEILGESGGNVAFEPCSVDSFLGALDCFRKAHRELRGKASQNQVIVKARFTRELMVEKLDCRIKELLAAVSHDRKRYRDMEEVR